MTPPGELRLRAENLEGIEPLLVRLALGEEEAELLGDEVSDDEAGWDAGIRGRVLDDRLVTEDGLFHDLPFLRRLPGTRIRGCPGDGGRRLANRLRGGRAEECLALDVDNSGFVGEAHADGEIPCGQEEADGGEDADQYEKEILKELSVHIP